MENFDLRRVIEDKKKMRKRLAALSFSEKIEIVEKMRRRDQAIAAAGLRRTKPKPADEKTASPDPHD